MPNDKETKIKNEEVIDIDADAIFEENDTGAGLFETPMNLDELAEAIKSAATEDKTYYGTLDKAIEKLMQDNQNVVNTYINFNGTKLYAVEMHSPDIAYKKLFNQTKQEYLDSVIKPIAVEDRTYYGTLDATAEKLIEANKNGQNIFVDFNGVKLYACEIDTVDKAYQCMFGQTKEEFNNNLHTEKPTADSDIKKNIIEISQEDEVLEVDENGVNEPQVFEGEIVDVQESVGNEEQIEESINNEINTSEEKDVNGSNNQQKSTRGTMSATEVKGKFNSYKNGEQYYAVHAGDKYEEGLAEHLNGIEQRKLEIEANINKLRGDIKKQKQEMNAGPFWLKAIRTLFVKPFKGIYRLFQKLIGKGDYIVYSPDELKLQDLKRRLSEEKEKVILVEKEKDAYIKVMDIDIEKDATIVGNKNKDITKDTDVKTEPAPLPKEKAMVNEPTEKETNNNTKEQNSEQKQEQKQRQPNATKIFEQMMQKVYGQDGFAAQGTKEGIIVDANDSLGNPHKFKFNQHKGELEPISFGVEGGMPENELKDLQKRAYITYTLASAKAGKEIISDKFFERVNEKVEKMLNGETKYANFSMGCVPVSISAMDSGTYAVSFNFNKNDKTADIQLNVPGEYLQKDILKETLKEFKLSYAMVMYKSYVNEQFIDFVKNSKVIDKLNPTKIENMKKVNNTIHMDVAVVGNKKEKPENVRVEFSTNTFEAKANEEDMAKLTQPQKIALMKALQSVEKAYASFIISNCKIAPETVLPRVDEVENTMNDNLESVKDGETKEFYAYGIVLNINKTAENPVVTIADKQGNILSKETLFNDGVNDKIDIADVYNQIASAMDAQAKQYNAAEATLENAARAKEQNKNSDMSVGDDVLENDTLSDGGGISFSELNQIMTQTGEMRDDR